MMRRARAGEDLTERALRTPARIVLDESVIPRRYARVLLTALYHIFPLLHHWVVNPMGGAT